MDKKRSGPQLKRSYLMAGGVLLAAVLVAWVLGELQRLGEQPSIPVIGTSVSQTDPSISHISSTTPGGTTAFAPDPAVLQQWATQLREEMTLTLRAGEQSVAVDLNRANAPIPTAELFALLGNMGLATHEVAAYLGMALTLNESNAPDTVYLTEKLAELAVLADNGADTSFVLTETGLSVVRGKDHTVFDQVQAWSQTLAALANGESEVTFALFTVPYQNPNMDELYAQVALPAVNAHYDVDENSNTIIVPETPGRDIDLEWIRKELEEGTWEEMVFPVTVIEPAITVDRVADGLFKDKLASGYTYYDPNNADRTNNLLLSCEAINDIIVLPGKTFSFNRVVGERTAERGYKKAAVYVGTALGTKQELGGGICQTASTLYYVTLHAEMKQISRYEHGYKVSYIRDGLDTTIYWGTYDYVFQNTSEYPVKIRAYCRAGALFCELYGTKPEGQENRTVSYVSEEIDVYDPPVVYEMDATMAPGTKKLVSYGQKGGLYYTYKVITVDGQEVSREKISQSKYNPMKKVYKVAPDVFVAWQMSQNQN